MSGTLIFFASWLLASLATALLIGRLFDRDDDDRGGWWCGA